MKILICVAISLAFLVRPGFCETPFRNAAIDAARWIRASSVKTPHGTVWPADPRDEKSVSSTLYAGTSGVILFFLEAYRSTGDQSLLREAQDGADHLLATLERERECGLYTGIAGIGFALTEVFKATGETRYREGALRCGQLLETKAKLAGKGVEWNDTTDIISGGAGIGLYLLYAARELNQQALRELALRDAYRLIELAKPESGGLKWAMNPTFARLMPNFSHGTAGIAYFLATVYQETKRKEFFDAAVGGANYLLSIAKTAGDACVIFHNEPDGRELYYLGWCHGPVGTARLFYRLHEVTGDRKWMTWVERAARGILESGIPEKQTPGFWNNISQCCGSAGVAGFFLDLYRVTGRQQYLAFARRVTSQLLVRATRDRDGLRWIQAEHRIKPELLVAQTGYMQGAAGVGMLLLHFDQHQNGKKRFIRFPDSPF